MVTMNDKLVAQTNDLDNVQDENLQISIRREKLTKLREQRQAFPNDFKRSELMGALLATYDNSSKEELEGLHKSVIVAGRIMTRRIMGKASFVHLQDMSGKIQIYIAKDLLGDDLYEEFKGWDLGDIIGVKGVIFKTKTNELSIKAQEIRLLTKALRPLPDKHHGLQDQEIRYRRRYLDLIVTEKSRQVFKTRSLVIMNIRQFLIDHDFQEVETPMMQVLAGGAAARPFETHHNALDMKMYLRIAPELYLKRLVVGGIERVFEINRNFRNEGLSTRHNPEFTMLEFYMAYADYLDAMDLTENLLRTVAENVLLDLKFDYQGDIIDFASNFERLDMLDAIVKYNPTITKAELQDKKLATKLAQNLKIEVKNSYGLGKIQVEIFEATTEHKLIQPTFITSYPLEVSPLARRSDVDENLTDRAELFCAGKEIANMFSELNDPEDQAERFRLQMANKASGDDEAMPYDEDYIVALEHGMPPTAGVGIGIDRLVMLFTNSASIRDVILFPHMRKER